MSADSMTHKQRVLQLLKDGKPHSHHELYQLGCVAHSRISDLRRDGHRIKAWRDKDLYLYKLEAAPVASTEPPASNQAPPWCRRLHKWPGRGWRALAFRGDSVTVFVNRVVPTCVWIYCRGVEVRADVDKTTGEAFCPSCGRFFKVSW